MWARAMAPGTPTPDGDALLHEPHNGLLAALLSQHLQTVLSRAAEADCPLPSFVARELEDAARCGELALGFVRAHCCRCGLDRVVGLSCKRRGICARCGGRRMAEAALRWRQRVLPHVPVRQWVLTLPVPLRLRLAWDDDLRRAVLRTFLLTTFAFLRRKARALGLKETRCGAITVVQRFGSALNLNIHFHTLMPDGVFVWSARQRRPVFHPLPAPTDGEI